MRFANSTRLLNATLWTTKFVGRYSKRLGGAVADRLWFIPWRVPVSERGMKKQAGWLRSTQPFTLRTSMGRITGFTAGDGPVVLLVHGWGESAATLGGFIAPLAEAGFRVVGVDLPAHGNSGGQTTNIIQSADALSEVAGHFGGAYAVVAHSMGANVALWAMKEGLGAERAVLIAPNVDMAYAMEAFEVLFGVPPKAIAGLKRKIERRFGPTVWRDIRGDYLARSVPATGLVFHDPEDPQVPFVGSERLVEAWKRAELIEAPGLGHGTITRDDSIIERGIAFLAKVGAQTRTA